jgi:hypothetical protein
VVELPKREIIEYFFHRSELARKYQARTDLNPSKYLIGDWGKPLHRSDFGSTPLRQALHQDHPSHSHTDVELSGTLNRILRGASRKSLVKGCSLPFSSSSSCFASHRALLQRSASIWTRAPLLAQERHMCALSKMAETERIRSNHRHWHCQAV